MCELSKELDTARDKAARPHGDPPRLTSSTNRGWCYRLRVPVRSMDETFQDTQTRGGLALIRWD